MLPYYPALRAKPGEFAACGRIASRYQVQIRPRFVVPSPQEPDPELGRVPTRDEIAHIIGQRMGRSWPLLPAFLDPRFAASFLGDDGIETLYRIAWSFNRRLIPVFAPTDLHNRTCRKLVVDGPIKGSICVDYEDADPVELIDGLNSIGIEPEHCVLFIDFTGAPLGMDAALSVAQIFDTVGNAKRWSKIVYQASAYPEQLPVEPGKQDLIPRKEWTTFLAALKETGVEPGQLGYGDFGADCGRIKFPAKRGGGRARPHLRYTGKSHTLVVRGSDSGPFTPTMRDVCRKIAENSDFYGRGFSYADDRIWRNSKNLTDSCGTPTDWRELNTAHHIVHVVRDLGAMAGITFKDDVISDVSEQGQLI